MDKFQVEYLIIGLLCFDFVFNKFISFLNDRHWQTEVPEVMADVLDADRYKTAATYHKANGKVALMESVLSFALMLLFIVMGWFGAFEAYIGTFTDSVYTTTALFFLGVFLVSDLLGLPFSIYQTFVIEAKFGFNKTTAKTFILDKLKGYVMTILLGGGLLWVVIKIYEQIETGYWLWLWLIISVFILLLNMFYADLILPIFNKLKPLEEGELYDEIKKYTDKIGYSIKHIYIIDGSKRSTKANAFFSGLGPRKTIALYDTLVEKQTVPELTAILAHEVGHYKKKHILTSMILSLVQLGVTLFLLEQFLSWPVVSQALGGNETSFALGLIAFGFIFSPIGLLIGIGMNVLSRKNEFEADAYAKSTYAGPPLVSGLKKLSVDALSNLYPHPWYVFVHYSHPPLLDRLKALTS